MSGVGHDLRLREGGRCAGEHDFLSKRELELSRVAGRAHLQAVAELNALAKIHLQVVDMCDDDETALCLQPRQIRGPG